MFVICYIYFKVTFRCVQLYLVIIYWNSVKLNAIADDVISQELFQANSPWLRIMQVLIYLLLYSFTRRVAFSRAKVNAVVACNSRKNEV